MKNGNPLAGVSVSIVGGKGGVSTDERGNFSIAVPENAVLSFSYVGYKTVTVPVNGRTSIEITLNAEVSALNDVVVVGYGTQKKASVTAAISTLDGKKVASIPISNLSNGIAGRVSGVIAKQDNGDPGQDHSNIYIRGISTIGNSQPLVVIDDIPHHDYRDFTQLDPNIIESVTILKDAAAVAPFGVAGANGVILVKTKRGKLGAPTLTYRGYVGFQNPTIVPKYVSGYQYGVLRNVAATNEGISLPYSDEALQKLKDGSDRDAFPDPNVFRDLLIKDAVLTNHNIELSGGTEKVKYYASLGYQFQASMWPTGRNTGTRNNRYNLDLNLDAQATKTTKIGLSVKGWQQDLNYPINDAGRLWELVAYANVPRGPLYFSNGLPGAYISEVLNNSGYNKFNTLSLNAQLSIEQDLPFIPGLKATGTIAYLPTYILNKTWSLPLHRGVLDTTQHPHVIRDIIHGLNDTKPFLNQSLDDSHQLTYQASLRYSRTFGRSNIGALALVEAESRDGFNLSASRVNYSQQIDELSLGSSDQADISNAGTSRASRQIGLVYRVTYDYAGKYLLEASGRYDGSYYFAPGHRYGFFPAFSVGWRLSEENFMKNITWIDNLKIRGSYGETGALAGAPFQYLSSYNVYGPAAIFGGVGVQGAIADIEGNPNITWERAKKFDVGLEASFRKGLLNIEVDYFHEKRSNMLLAPNVIVPLEYGIRLSQQNAGIMKNQGIDFSISSVHKIRKDLQVSLDANFTYAKNALLQVFETSSTFDNPNRRVTGKPLGTSFGYQAMGFFQPEDFKTDGTLKDGVAHQPWEAVKPGDIRYEDKNGDGDITPDDLTSIGRLDVPPPIIYGISPAIRYKGVSLDLLFQGAANVNAYVDRQNRWPFYNGENAFVDNFNYWTPENRNAKYPRVTPNPTENNTQTSSFWVVNSSYLRLKSATLSYTIPSSITEKIRLQSVRVYASGQNVLTWTKMINFDPESTSPYSNLYPQQRVISVGLNVTF